MHRVDTEGHDDGLFQDGNPQVGQQGTTLSEEWLNDLQENICGVIEHEDGGDTPLVKGDPDQLRLAIATMIAAAASAAQAAAIAAARVRPGVIEMFGAAAAPAGYLACDGAAVSRTTYADLFEAIGTVWGVGDGATTFNVPDLRGEFVRGWDDGRGIDAGRDFASAQAQAIQAHVHSIPSNSDQGTGTASVEDGDGSGTPRAINTGSTGGTETRPRNVAALFIIKT